MKKKELFVLSHLYEELRHYRSKEFQTFAFSFPVVAAGLLPNFSQTNSIAILVTLFAAFMIHYIWKNHLRMMKIRRVIFTLQKSLDLNNEFHDLKPEKWEGKEGIYQHLGTFTYILILFIEVVLVWRDPVWETVKNAA